MNSNILDIQNLSLRFGENQILKNVSFSVPKGKIIGVVGESGSGKSITSLAVMGLLPKSAQIPSESGILFHSDSKTIDLLKLSPEQKRKYRGKEIGMIFQEPMTSLNPSICCGEQVGEAIRLHLELENHV